VSPGSGTPTGNVTFDDRSTVPGTVTLTNRAASFTTLSSAVGTHSIKAVYAGDTRQSDDACQSQGKSASDCSIAGLAHGSQPKTEAIDPGEGGLRLERGGYCHGNS
jgi:hypothetical protein